MTTHGEPYIRLSSTLISCLRTTRDVADVDDEDAALALDAIAHECELLAQCLALARRHSCLQTRRVWFQTLLIMPRIFRVALGLHLMSNQPHWPILEPRKPPTPEDYEWAVLWLWHLQLVLLRTDIRDAILASPVGLHNDPVNGWWISKSDLLAVNERVTAAFGTNLHVFNLMRGRFLDEPRTLLLKHRSTRADVAVEKFMFKLSDADLRELGLVSDEPTRTAPVRYVTPSSSSTCVLD